MQVGCFRTLHSTRPRASPASTPWQHGGAQSALGLVLPSWQSSRGWDSPGYPCWFTICTRSDRWACLVAQKCHTGYSRGPAEQRIFSSVPCKSQPALRTSFIFFFSLLCLGNLSAPSGKERRAELALGVRGIGTPCEWQSDGGSTPPAPHLPWPGMCVRASARVLVCVV